MRAARLAAQAGADGITAHLREDRRHISDRDIELLSSEIDLPLNLEMAATPEMLAIALRHKLDVIQQTTRALTDIIDTERSVRLEAIIVALIAVEILIAFFDLFYRVPR